MIGIVIFLGMWMVINTIEENRSETEDPGHVWNENLCSEIDLPFPGALATYKAEVCYVPGFGWHETNTRSLQDELYQQYIQPLYREVRYAARLEGVYNETHNMYMYRRNLRAAQDAYQGRE